MLGWGVPRTDSASRIGLIVPSSNPTIERFLADADVLAVLGIETVVTRLGVQRIDVDSDEQFAAAPLRAAAELLRDAEPDLTVWAGTSAFWVPEVSASLSAIAGAVTDSRAAMIAALQDIGTRDIAVLTPYTSDIHAAVLASFAGEGFTVGADTALGLSRNLDFAQIPPESIVREVAALGERPVAMVCTNMLATSGAPVIVDSIIATLWHAARLSGSTELPYVDAFAGLVSSRRHRA